MTGDRGHFACVVFGHVHRTGRAAEISAPALRALHNAGYTTLQQLANAPRRELAGLHGMGPKALRIIEQALAEHGLQLS